MQSPFQVALEAPVIHNSNFTPKQQDIQEILESQPTLFFSLLYELYNRKSTTKDGKRSSRLSKVVSEGNLEEAAYLQSDSGPFTWSSVVSSLQDLAGDTYIDSDTVEPIIQVGQGGFAKVFKGVWKKNGEGEEQDDKVVAIKQLKNTELEAQDLEELIAEANLLRKLDSPYIVSFYGMGATNTKSHEDMRSSLFLVQEFVGGGTLKDLLTDQFKLKSSRNRKKLYSFSDAFRWLLQIAEALAYLHAQSPVVVHRDLKPENVLLTEGPTSEADVRLVDFGLHKRIIPRSGFRVHSHGKLQRAATTGSLTKSFVNPVPAKLRRLSDDSANSQGHRLYKALISADLDTIYSESKIDDLDKDSTSEDEVLERLNLAATGTLHSVRSSASGRAGSHMYMSPEALNEEHYTEKVDVFSLGVLAYELLRGRLNMEALGKEAGKEGWNSNEALSRYAGRISRGWRERIPPWWPLEVQEFVGLCWEQDPQMRPRMSDVVLFLKSLQKEEIVRKMKKKRSIFKKIYRKIVYK
eukprot:TRINITY_DN22113_c0_g1_i1.p1 TRINITY_DN22113_c0_g1~~TRINITY_DN22113_c0_g1_i1.p1  ORF type:complete len:522 (-),score=86.51 TRINITY_DN22113_c0_g1_i1:399-1964(-)